jgi:hypothetical protein
LTECQGPVRVRPIIIKYGVEFVGGGGGEKQNVSNNDDPDAAIWPGIVLLHIEHPMMTMMIMIMTMAVMLHNDYLHLATRATGTHVVDVGTMMKIEEPKTCTTRSNERL